MQAVNAKPKTRPDKRDGRNGRPLVITLDEAARLLSLDQVCKNPRRCVRGMVKRGELVAVWVSKYMMIDRASIDRVVAGE